MRDRIYWLQKPHLNRVPDLCVYWLELRSLHDRHYPEFGAAYQLIRTRERTRVRVRTTTAHYPGIWGLSIAQAVVVGRSKLLMIVDSEEKNIFSQCTMGSFEMFQDFKSIDED